jgi:hypothetical protein
MNIKNNSPDVIFSLTNCNIYRMLEKNFSAKKSSKMVYLALLNG